MKCRCKIILIVFIISIYVTGCSDKNFGTGDVSVKTETKKEFVQNDFLVEEGLLEIHYLDVGQADATLVRCDGKNMLIDGGNAEDSSLIYAYLKEHNIGYLDYMICTHIHEDHIGGLSGALNYAKVGTVYCPADNSDEETFHHFMKYLKQQNAEITIPQNGEEFLLGNAKCKILGLNVLEDNPNNTSIVLKITYGYTSFLFSGDAEDVVERSIINEGQNIDCTVMKIPHHGSKTSTSEEWLTEASPSYGIISVGENNSYGHPSEETLRKLNDKNVEILRTDYHGHIICFSDKWNVWFRLETNPDY